MVTACRTATYTDVMAPVDYVNPLMGTLSDFSFSAGNTYPAVALPWGMHFWTPQTGKMGNGWAYTYTDKKIRGFKQTHQPSPWINDYGAFSLMPVTGGGKCLEEDRASWFSHKAEVAKPYYYSVYLADHDITAEITPTERAALFRFTFPRCDSAFVVVDAYDRGSFIALQPDRQTLIGYSTRNSGGVPDNFKNYFVMVFERPVEIYDSTCYQANHALVGLGFSTQEGEPLLVKVASSFISFEQAFQNIRELEINEDHFGKGLFDRIKEAAAARWNEVLGRIRVAGGTDDQYRTFYSCLYRSLLFPRKLYEVSAVGDTVHYSPHNGQICSGPLYTDTGFWDTFRSLFPLLNLVYPSVNREIQEGLLHTYLESGFLPEWASPGHRNCMIGNNSASVVADAIVKGVTRTAHIDSLYAAMVHGTNHVHPKIRSTGRLGHEYYNALGYIPYDVGINENVARTLEYAYNDWCILQVAKWLDRPAEEVDLWSQRSQNYRNVFDPQVNLMRGRNKDGTFQSPFSPYKWGDAFTEGNSWHYSFSVFHDVPGLIDLMGGPDAFVARLDSVFLAPPLYDDSYYGYCIHEIKEMQVADMGNYAHGNQPAQHMIYLYDYADAPEKTQYWVREVMNRLYSATPDGYCGDEDNGQTSAWYVFSALGFYPVCPASLEYAVGAPLFKKATIQLENGRQIVVSAPENSRTHRYAQQVTVNGKRLNNWFFDHRLLAGGTTITFDMTN
ncbi:MAG: GH92 family glycosyl hydrolase [Bacteroidetes bacterium]|nr:GH92 family glycosyl hydrolase [Bacteroidota bacterium]